MFDYIIVGAGFSGCVLAERLSSQLNKKVLVVDKRNHIGGNAFDFYNEDGILVHKYGVHIFHTNSKNIYDYISQFTAWRKYEHEVLASVDGMLVPIPININTLNKLYYLDLSESEAKSFFESRAVPNMIVRNSEDVIVSKIGVELYEKFYKGYTKKMWDLYPAELDASVTSRIPIRTNKDDRYFTDEYQVIPLHGYSALFSKMIANKNIEILLNADYKDIKNTIPHDKLIYTGCIDEYFDYCYGKLPYRSMQFKHETLNTKWFQSCGAVNYPNTEEYTRITEWKYITGQEHNKTSIVYEFPTAVGEPYYPIPRPANAEQYRLYERMADSISKDGIYFVGRLATYKYYNMDQVVAQALTLFKKIASA